MSLLSHKPTIDLVVLSRDDSSLHPDVLSGIEAQTDVRLIVHRVVGRRKAGEESRLHAIVRARNEGKRCGTAPWLMFLDDDVALAPESARRLVEELHARPEFAALGADYLGESRGQMSCAHVAMGAVLFRRAALNRIRFHWRPGQCECLCCCQDLRRQRMGIVYLPDVKARHISLRSTTGPVACGADVAATADDNGAAVHSRNGPAYVLAAFDRRHCQKFQHRFLGSLRAAGNSETVLAFGYGLYPSERRQVERLPGVRLIPIAPYGVAVPIRRLLDFQGPLAQLPGESVVAYWDAGDVIFQDRLTELWRLARENPTRLLVVSESFKHPENRAVSKWTLSITDPAARKKAFELLAPGPFFNSGFAAASVRTMLRYLREANSLIHSTAMRGTEDWGDQTAMNLYCHSDRSRYLEVDDRWNYCICGRRPHERQILPEGRFVRRDGHRISVIHGNGGTLVRYGLSSPLALARCSRTSKFLF